jgi:hypothetical protein
MGLFGNLFKSKEEEKYPLDIACANVLIILTEHVSAYDDRKSIQEIMHLENKLKWRNTFLTAAFDHLEHNDLIIISKKIEKMDTNSRTKLLVDCMNSIKEESDNGAPTCLDLDDSPNNFFYEFLFTVHTIFQASKEMSERFSKSQIHFLSIFEKMYNNNLEYNDQILFKYETNDNYNMVLVVSKGKFEKDQIDDFIINNEKYINSINNNN